MRFFSTIFSTPCRRFTNLLKKFDAQALCIPSVLPTARLTKQLNEGMVSPGPRARAFVARPGWPLIYQDFRSVVRQDRGELSNLAFRMQRPWIAAITHRRSGGRWSTTGGTGEGTRPKAKAAAAAHRKGWLLVFRHPRPGPLWRARGAGAIPVGWKLA